jgi:hypothetical protein
MTSSQLLPLRRDLYSKHPEMRDLEAWELQQALCSEGGERSEPEININGLENRPRGDMSEKGSLHSLGSPGSGARAYDKLVKERMAELEPCIHNVVGGCHLCRPEEGSAP